MENQRFFRQLSLILPITLLFLFLSLPVSAGTNYSIEVVTPSYIEATTELPIRGDDVYLGVPIPFSFTFYGISYTEAYVNTNGYLNFIAGYSSYMNFPLPSAMLPNAAIYAFWDDLYLDYSSSVRTELLGVAPNRQFVIEWRDARFYGDYSRRLDFEIVLYETGIILFQYRNFANDGREMGNSATIGVEDDTGTVAAAFSFNRAAIGPGDFAIRFAPLGKAVAADVKPTGCPNPLNVGSKGVLPFAILGTGDFDVTTIEPSTVTLGGVAPLRWNIEDVATPYEPFVGKTDPYQCNTLGPDGYLDIVFKFDTEEITAALGEVNDGEVFLLQLGGELQDGTPISGEDVVIIRKAKEKKRK
jgi:hypothetical protein